MKTKKSNIKNQSGITLVALVVTIIILIILATISIQMVVGEDGLIGKANQAKVEYRAAEVEEEVLAWKAEKKMAEYATGITPQERDALIDDQLARGLLTQEEADTAKKEGEVKIGSRTIHYGEDTQTDQSDEPAKVPTTVKEAKNTQYHFEDTTTLKDEKENNVVIPGKFHVATDSGISVQEGVVIEDNDGNQFVWIPVSNIDGNNDSENSKPIIKDDKSTVTITLGRYENFTMSGATMPTPMQTGSMYADQTAIRPSGKDYDFQELNINGREAGTKDSSTENATAKDLKAFVESVQKNHGYYIGRYEASYGSGSSFGVGADTSYYKPLVQKSIANSTSEMDCKKGTLWNFITQGNASKVSRNMYNESDAEYKYVESDLVNSYMWDTAIVYIQAMGNSNYANQQPLSDSLTNTGETGDEKCHIYDMAGNVYEWTTEYSTSTNSSHANPCVCRGGYYRSSSVYTAHRGNNTVAYSSDYHGFRPALYIKSNPEG